MANTSSAKKAIRQQAKKTIKNLRRKRDFRDSRREVLKAVEAGDLKLAQTSLQDFYQKVDKAAKHNGPLHENTAARYKARLTQVVNKLATK
jgi:small subunit ribosomal protein S20